MFQKDVTTYFFFHRHMRWNSWRNRISYTFSLEERNEKRGRGNPSASNISSCISLLFQSGALACDHFRYTCFSGKKYFSASVRLTTWNDRDGGEEVVKIDAKEANEFTLWERRNVGTVLNKWILEIYSLIHCVYTRELKTRLSKRYCWRINL